MNDSKMKKNYYFPCNDKITLNGDAGHALGIIIAENGVTTNNVEFSLNGEKCKKCTLNCKKDVLETDVTHTFCACYSKEYLSNKDKETITYLNDGGKLGRYCIEVIIQYEDYRHVLYMEGETEGCALMDFVNEHLCESMFDELYDEETEKYCLYMINIKTYKTRMFEFDSFTDILAQIVSIRYIE